MQEPTGTQTCTKLPKTSPNRNLYDTNRQGRQPSGTGRIQNLDRTICQELAGTAKIKIGWITSWTARISAAPSVLHNHIMYVVAPATFGKLQLEGPNMQNRQELEVASAGTGSHLEPAGARCVKFSKEPAQTGSTSWCLRNRHKSDLLQSKPA